MINKDVKNKRISVLGCARSGVNAALFLHRKGAIVFISDQGQPSTWNESKLLLENVKISYEINGHTDKILDADMLVISPSIPHNHPYCEKARENGIPIFSEIEMTSWFFEKPIIAITGTNGKTTSSEWLGYILLQAGISSFVAGNNENAFSSTEQDWVSTKVGVLEISSFQLETIESFHPTISVITNITPDHLDRHGTMANYARTKFRITEKQNEKDHFIYQADDLISLPYLNEVKAKPWPFSTTKKLTIGGWLDNGELKLNIGNEEETLIHLTEILIPGIHNVQNALTAALAARLFGVPIEAIRTGLRTFQGVEHRIEFVRELHGVSFYNDSKSTVLDSLKVALESFSFPIILLLGGREPQPSNDYTQIKKLIKEKTKVVIVMGESKEKICRELEDTVPLCQVESLQEAVLLSQEKSTAGDVVLFSPACKSFDAFGSYKERGNKFKTMVYGLS